VKTIKFMRLVGYWDHYQLVSRGQRCGELNAHCRLFFLTTSQMLIALSVAAAHPPSPSCSLASSTDPIS